MVVPPDPTMAPVCSASMGHGGRGQQPLPGPHGHPRRAARLRPRHTRGAPGQTCHPTVHPQCTQALGTAGRGTPGVQPNHRHNPEPQGTRGYCPGDRVRSVPQPGGHRSPVPAPALCAAAPNPFSPPPSASQHGHCSGPTSAPRCPRSAPRYGRGAPLGSIRTPIPGGAAARPLPSASSRLAPARLRRGCGSHA